jgi:16S rRNA (cytosine967-C5)-methyltransferase
LSERAAARPLAARVLARVWSDRAFAAAALDAELSRAALDRRDAALATELVYGVLRAQGYLNGRLAALASRPGWSIERLPPLARAHLLMGAYSVAFLDRVPTFAAVSEAVSGVSAAIGPEASRFTNAVLRRLAGDLDKRGRPSLGEAALASAPAWLRGTLRRSLGRAGAAAYLAAGPVPPPIGLCLASDEPRDAWLERLREAAPGASIEPGQVSPRAILVRGAGEPRRLPGFERAWIVQEEGAQVVALALGAAPGERVLDACAGRGNKAFLLHEAVGAAGAVDAADLYSAKLAALGEGARGAWTRAGYEVDWSQGTGEVPEGYDRVLVDAPCSGVGTLRRRPEIAAHKDPAAIERLRDLQALIARRAATRARDGGRLVFAVCSVLREEAEDVVDVLSRRAPEDPMDLVPSPFDPGLVGDLARAGASLRLTPHEHGTDGYFVASFVVKRR